MKGGVIKIQEGGTLQCFMLINFKKAMVQLIGARRVNSSKGVDSVFVNRGCE